MTTEEFKREIEKLGLILKDVVINSPHYFIQDEKGNIYAEVSYVCEYEMKIHGGIVNGLEKRKQLFQILTEYTATPIEEREPKRYFKYKLKSFFKKQKINNNWLNFDSDLKRYFLDTPTHSDSYQTIFEENDPLLNDANLDMFDAIEVDADGNEI